MTERVMVAAGGAGGEAALAWANHRARTVAFEAEVTTSRSRLGLAELVTASRRVDVLVIGRAGGPHRGGTRNDTLALKVAGQADCTVVVVPAGWAPGSGAVVVGWTDDPTADNALDFAAREAAILAVPLTIIHTYGVPQAEPMASEAPRVRAERLTVVDRRSLMRAADRIRLAYPSLTVTEHPQDGSAAVAIIRAAEGASLVVVGSRGRGALAGFFLGSVSHDVLLTMSAPVAVVPRRVKAGPSALQPRPSRSHSVILEKR